MKKLLSILLAVAMMASLTSVVLATGTTEGEVTGPTAYEYPTYESVADLPTCSPGPGLVAVVIMKPDDELGGHSYTRFIFSHGIDIGGYDAGWGLGFIDPIDGGWKFWAGDNHMRKDTWNYGQGYSWGVDENGLSYFQNVIVPANVEGADGAASEGAGKTEGYVEGEPWKDVDGNEYATLYDMAKAGQLAATLCEHHDQNQTGLADGWVNCHIAAYSGWMVGTMGNIGSNSNHFANGYDGIYVRVTTEEDYYTYDDNGEINGVKDAAQLAYGVAHMADGSLVVNEKNGDGSYYLGKLSFVFKDWEATGLNVTWGVTIVPKGEDGEIKKPQINEFTWYNCDGDEPVLINGTSTETNWQMEEFKWFEDENGDTVFQVIFAIPYEAVDGAGYTSLDEIADDNHLYGYIVDTAEGVTGKIESDSNAGLKANTTVNGKDAVFFHFVSGYSYYNESVYNPDQGDESTGDGETKAPDDGNDGETNAPSADTKDDETAATTDKPEEKKGCGSTIGALAIVLAAAVAAPVAFARKKD